MPGSQRDSSLSGAVPDELPRVGQDKARSTLAVGHVISLFSDCRRKVHRRTEIDAFVANKSVSPDTEVLAGLAKDDNDAGAVLQIGRDENWNMRAAGTCADGQTDGLQPDFMKA
jgi:hypothetical protein